MTRSLSHLCSASRSVPPPRPPPLMCSLALQIRAHKSRFTGVPARGSNLCPRTQRYDLLLKELVKCTPADHVDRAGLEEAQRGAKTGLQTLGRHTFQDQQRAFALPGMNVCLRRKKTLSPHCDLGIKDVAMLINERKRQSEQQRVRRAQHMHGTHTWYTHSEASGSSPHCRAHLAMQLLTLILSIRLASVRSLRLASPRLASSLPRRWSSTSPRALTRAAMSSAAWRSHSSGPKLSFQRLSDHDQHRCGNRVDERRTKNPRCTIRN